MKKIIVLAIALLVRALVFAQGYRVGDVAKDFSLVGVDGRKTSLSDYKDANGFIVIFTCNHCPFSKAYEQRIQALDKKYANEGYPVIAINPNDATLVPEDSYEHMVQLAAEKKYTFPYLYDETQETAAAFGASRTPHVFVLNKENGKNVVKYIGAIDNNTEDPQQADKKYVEDAVDALINHKPIEITQTKAIGCSIKWKD
jgi:glutathione peroxidase-family protein